ncbi:methylated-DNA--[protein]-cysteine S-methyltransferase [Paenibacillaceae bacterium WGS1546]|uniref:methylated-DNA--[protein]-cysteine S-methyltransferase n=1 Tax=Cohnella sp. WGS1546 TaxID=3366810 RepID=UPI00372D5C43
MNYSIEPVYWSIVPFDGGDVHVAATSKGLAFVGSQGKSFEELSGWAAARLPGSPLVRDDRRLLPYAEQLAQYLQGARTEFTHTFDLRGTPFQLAVWQALLAIPYGETRSYAEIAAAIRKPSAARAVGAAIGANPVLISVPCHRVVGKDGSLTGYRGGLEMKRRLLRLEGRLANEESSA